MAPEFRTNLATALTFLRAIDDAVTQVGRARQLDPSLFRSAWTLG